MKNKFTPTQYFKLGVMMGEITNALQYLIKYGIYNIRAFNILHKKIYKIQRKMFLIVRE